MTDGLDSQNAKPDLSLEPKILNHFFPSFHRDDQDDNDAKEDDEDDDEDNHQIAAASGRSHLNSGSVSIAESPLMPSSSSLSSLSLLKYRVFF